MRKICFITGTRAEYGLLSRIMAKVRDDDDCTLQVIATNMHLMPEYGETYREIEADGFVIDERVKMDRPSDDSVGILESMATELRSMAYAIDRLKPDIAVILGDRYEMLIAAIACMMQRVPIAHLYGGEITEGAYDDSIRHCITKLSSLHFTSTEEYRHRVIELGEHPDRVFYAGAIGVENIKEVPLMNLEALEEDLGVKIGDNTVLVTYHPVTLDTQPAAEAIDAFLKALDKFPELNVIFTMPNSDNGSDAIREAIVKWTGANANRAHCFASLGMKRYLSLLPHVRAVLGNSSSGLVEVPSAHIPTLNIGDRQKGRARGASVLDCPSDQASIESGISQVLSPEWRQRAATAANPYEKEGTADLIFDTIKNFSLENLTRKNFYDIAPL